MVDGFQCRNGYKVLCKRAVKLASYKHSSTCHFSLYEDIQINEIAGSLQAISGNMTKSIAARFTTVSLEVKNRLGYGRWLPVKTGCEINNPTQYPSY